MILTQRGAREGQGLLEVPAGVFRFSQLLLDHGQVVEVGHYLGMVFAQGLLIDLEGRFEVEPCTFTLAELAQEAGYVGEGPGGFGMDVAVEAADDVYDRAEVFERLLRLAHLAG
jgi:hypothetical protein